MADFTLRYDSATGQLVGEDSNGNEIPIPLNALDVSGSASIDGNVESFTAGHDEVDVPQVRNLTVEDWESGTLDTDVWRGATNQFTVQSNRANSGTYSVRGEAGSNGGARSTHSFSGLSAYPQAGDEFEFSFQLGTTDTTLRFSFGIKEPFFSTISDGYVFLIRNGSIRLQEVDSRSRTTLINPQSAFAPANEWITVNVKWGTDGVFEIVEKDSTGSVITEGNNKDNPSELFKSGGVGLRVFDALGNQSSVYFDDLTVKRREPEARANTQKGVTELGNEVVPSGAIQTGPQTASTNAKRVVYQDAPVDSSATQGTESLLTMLQSGVNPAMYMERTMDGQGGAYAHQLQTALGRFARINANLSWQNGSLANVGGWEIEQQSSNAHSFQLTDHPRRLELSHGTTDSNQYGGVRSTYVVNEPAFDAFTLTFHNVSYTDNDINNGLRFGLTNAPMDDNVLDYSGIVLDYSNAGAGEVTLYAREGGNSIGFTNVSKRSWGTNRDVSVSWNGDTAGAFIDGERLQTASGSFSSDHRLRPFVQVEDSTVTAETLSIEQVTVEPLAEVLQ